MCMYVMHFMYIYIHTCVCVCMLVCVCVVIVCFKYFVCSAADTPPRTPMVMEALEPDLASQNDGPVDAASASSSTADSPDFLNMAVMADLVHRKMSDLVTAGGKTAKLNIFSIEFLALIFSHQHIWLLKFFAPKFVSIEFFLDIFSN